MQYVFVGTESFIGAIKLHRFGQVVELPAELAGGAQIGGCPIVSKPAFDSVRFTAEDLQRYTDVGSHAGATPEFLEKKHRAILAFQAEAVQVRADRATVKPAVEVIDVVQQ